MEMKDKKLATEVAEERMSMIAPLLSQYMDGGQVAQIRQEICERNQISQRTLERYLSAYLSGGFDALKPQSEYSARDCAPQPLKLSIHSGGIEHPCRCR